MKQSKSPKTKAMKRKVVSAAAVLLAAVQMSATASAAVPVFGQLSLTNLVATSLMSDYSRTVAPGLVETRFAFTNLNSKINECFMLEYDPSAGQIGITVGTPGNTTYASGYHAATVRAQAAAAMAHGKPVVAAINGDMYNMATNQPWGVVIQDGVELQGTVSSRAYRWNFFGIKKDGTPVIASNADYPKMKSELQNAIGLYDTLLVKDGNVVAQKSEDQRTFSPRLGVGIRADGTVFFVMIDGRQSQYSTGATLKELAQIMKDMGAVQAGNLDAGGSATLLSRNSGSSTLILRNKPSDGKERSVPNSLLFVTKSASM
ncbi:phosphodiester glycosidase family protein [Faecalispora anaeroviscerum]|uniref:phosphodiester glycosidase family protein n=1 Tax=Faecalispora anaeroviscerum TaxID=2991836 RepID=UPI0024B9F077|nr:phosphodiester glycosidase family protein [Faecalispora anaeroviscerum]